MALRLLYQIKCTNHLRTKGKRVCIQVARECQGYPTENVWSSALLNLARFVHDYPDEEREWMEEKNP